MEENKIQNTGENPEVRSGFSYELWEIVKVLLISLAIVLPVRYFVAQPFIIATGKAKYSLLTIPFGITNIGLGILFIGYYGFIGVIYSTLITSITNKILTFYLIYNGLRKMR